MRKKEKWKKNMWKKWKNKRKITNRYSSFIESKKNERKTCGKDEKKKEKIQIETQVSLKRKRGIFFLRKKSEVIHYWTRTRKKNEKKKTYLACYCSRHMLMNICALQF